MINFPTREPNQPATVHLHGVPRPLSRLVLGTMTFGDTVDAHDAARMLDAALDGGITAIDTANVYAGGATEEILGDLLPSRRERVTLATKAGMPHPDIGDHAPLSAGGLRASLEGSCDAYGSTTSTCSTCTSRTAVPHWPRRWPQWLSSSRKERSRP